MKYEKLATEKSVKKTADALAAKGYQVFIVKSGADALEKIKKIIPAGASVMNGSSATLEQIGYIEYLASERHPWVNLHGKIVGESDDNKKRNLRRQALLSDYYLGSVHALAQTGEFIIASNTGSQLPHTVYSSPNLIFVVSTKKIVSDLPEAFQRLEKHVVPLEDENMRAKYGFGTTLNKVVIFKGENKKSGRTIIMILVKENLGF